MAYHLTIVRTVGGKQQPISESEFTAAIEALGDSNLSRVAKGAVLRVGDQREYRLTLADGEVWSGAAEPEVLSSMLSLARLMNARVRGDEFETYRSPDETYLHPDDESLRAKATRESSRLRRGAKRSQMVFHLIVFGTFAVLIAIVATCSKR